MNSQQFDFMTNTGGKSRCGFSGWEVIKWDVVSGILRYGTVFAAAGEVTAFSCTEHIRVWILVREGRSPVVKQKQTTIWCKERKTALSAERNYDSEDCPTGN